MTMLDDEMPIHFRCPISLDLMKYPVSLSTGITYDLSSIQTWLSSGHNTCPATMQILPPNPLFIPNLTLLRLINLYLHPPVSRSALLSPDSLSRILRDPSTPDSSKIALAETLASSIPSKIAIAETLASNSAILDSNDLLADLIRHITNPITCSAFLSCILSLSATKPNKKRLVRGGVVAAIGIVLSDAELAAVASNSAIKVLESLLGCAEGRSAVCGDRGCVIGVARRMMRAPESGVSELSV